MKRQLNWENVKTTCSFCGQEFWGKRHQIYCSPECYKKGIRWVTNYRRRKKFRERKFARLLAYVEENNMREILAKYKPKQTA